MSNTLFVEFVEIKVKGSDESMVGFIATDNNAMSAWRVANDWVKFKVSYPSIESVMSEIAADSNFAGLSNCYEIVDGSVKSVSSDFAEYSEIIIEGEIDIF